MTRSDKPTKPPPKGYKRSWKNLLLNKRYQLQFTLFMVGLSAVLMAGLGVWVMKEANEATTVAMARVRGEACPKVPMVVDTGAGDDDSGVPMKLDDAPGSDGTPDGSAAAGSAEPGSAGPGSAAAGSAAPGSDPVGSAAPGSDAVGSAAPPMPVKAHSAVDPKDVAKHNAMADVIAVGNIWCVQRVPCVPARAEPLVIKSARCDAWVKDKLADPVAVEALRKAMIPVVKCDGGQSYTVADAPEAEHHVKVQLDESSMTLTPTVPADYADRVVAHWTCKVRQMGAIDALERGRMRILWMLIATGLVLILGLAVYGIKMTHKVAGPLFKVGLYLTKMRDGRFDKVYNLRKGDQLVDFYDHFKLAHAGVVQLEHDDIAQIKALIAAAEATGNAGHATIVELRAVLARKEKSVE